MLARLAVARELLPDAFKDDMARDVLVDVARNVDEIKLCIALLREEECLIDRLAAADRAIDRNENLFDLALLNPS